MQSCIYKGSVHHVRRRPKHHRLHYRVFSVLIDLDEFQEINSAGQLFRVNRPGLFSFWERGHGNGDEGGLKSWVLTHLMQAGFEAQDISVRLLCYPRILGYVFNPLSVYYCYDRNGILIATLHEVNNTFGEKHTYVLPAVPKQDSNTFRQSSPKNLAVSPFTEMDMRYQFDMTVPKESIHVHIALHDAEGSVMSASFTGIRHSLTDRKLAVAVLQYPLMTLKVTAGIHIEALRLWLKGVPLVTRTVAPKPITASHQSPVEPQPYAD